MQIIDAKDGSKLKGFFSIADVQIYPSSGGDYAQITLMDNTGILIGKRWSVTPKEIEDLQKGKVIRIDASTVQIWKESLQCIISVFQVMDLQDSGAKVEDLVYIPPESPEKMWNELSGYVDGLDNDTVKTIVQDALAEVKEKFLYYPAARKLHHAHYAGLLQHTLGVARAAVYICSVRPFLNKNFVLGGSILHDLRKIDEYNYNPLVLAEFAPKGRMLGHVYMGARFVRDVASKKGLENTSECDHLEHIVLSHHGTREHGSPVLPQTPEAIAVHLLDSLDATLQSVQDAIRTSPEGAHETGYLKMASDQKILFDDYNRKNSL